jgi:hypothetical protein
MTPAEPPGRAAGSGSGNDPFSWLYQRGQPAPTEDEAPPVPPTVEDPVRPSQPQQPQYPTAEYSTPQAPPPMAPAPPIRPEPPGPPPTYVLPAWQPGTAPQPQPQPPPPEDPPRRHGPIVAIVVGALLVAVLAGIAVAVLVDRSKRTPDPSIGPVRPAATPAATPATSPPPAPSSTAAVKPVASGVSADCTAPPATDDAGKPVSYDAGNVLDGDSSTAWRCDGNGDGHTMTFTFPAGTTISTVGLVNGYAKTDPKSGAKRYGEYRRISRVTWTFDDGSSVDQKLADGTQKVQTTSVGPVQTQRVTLTIDGSTKPGRSAKSRNAVLISEVSFG